MGGFRSAVALLLGVLALLVAAAPACHGVVVNNASHPGPDERKQGIQFILFKLWDSISGGSYAYRAWATADYSSYRKLWPKFEFNWRMVVGSILSFLGAALGSVGGVGGGGFFVPILTLVIGFDAKTATALSKSMIMGAAFSTICFNLKRKHPTKDEPVIDYDIALLFQPMLLLGISIGVAFNVMFADWMVTLFLILLFSGISWNTFCKAVVAWKSETSAKVQRPTLPTSSSGLGIADVTQVEPEYMPLPSEDSQQIDSSTIWGNVRWKEMRLLLFVWLVFLILQVVKIHVQTCSFWYWLLDFLQIPVAVTVTSFQVAAMCKKVEVQTVLKEEPPSHRSTTQKWEIWNLAIYAAAAIGAGIMGGLLGVGGGAVIGPLLLELGMPPEVTTATATFVMVFSSSLSVVEYYLMDRIPSNFAIYLIILAMIAAVAGQSVIRQIILASGKASIIIFALACCVAFSTVVLGLQGGIKVYLEWEAGAYMGFESLCAA